MKSARTGITTALVCLLACAACGDEAGDGGRTTGDVPEHHAALEPAPGVPTRDPAQHPVRLARGARSSRSPVLVSVTHDDLDALELLDPATATLRPATDDDAGLRVSDGQIRPAQPEELMAILFELDAGDAVSIRARLGIGEELVTSEPCRGLRLIRLRVLEEGESLSSLRAAGGLPHPSGRRQPLGAAILHRRTTAHEASLARWASPPAADGLAVARFVLPQHGRRTLWAAVLSGDGTRPATLGNLEAVRKPVFERFTDGFSVPTASEGAGGEARWLDLKVGGELRSSLVVPAGVAEEIEVRVPLGATRLAFGACVTPGHAPGGRATWIVERMDGGIRELARGELTVVGQEPLRIHFQDVEAAWPSDAGASRNARLRFRVEGDVPVAFGAPMLLAPSVGRRPPNLLLISLDTLRADHLGCYGYPRPTSPFLDGFAERATLFTDAQTVAPYTLPSQVSLLTGLMPPSHGVVDAGTDRLDATAVPYLPELLADAGWVTAAFAGGGYVSADYGFAAGFDRFASVDPFLFIPEVQEHMGLTAVHDWIERHEDMPWFLFLHTFATHDYRPTEEDFALFDTRTGPADERRELALFPGPDGRKNVTPTPEQLEDMLNMYDASIRYADRMLGQLMDSLESRGLLEDTIVVITSDHGEEFGEHGGMRHARSLHREMLHVPLIVRTPGMGHGRVVRDPVSVTDLFPTLLELLGLPAPDATKPVDGRSITALLPPTGSPRTGTVAELPPPMLLGHIDTHTSRRSSLQVGPLKIIRGDMSEALEFPAPAPWALYDVRADPGELVDLAGDRPEDLEKMRRHLEALEAGLRARAAPGALGDLDESVLEQLRELGYVR